MSGQSVRVVNVVPLPKHTIKQEVDSGDDDDTICCKICAKGFVSALALRNHAMMEHFDAFSTGNPSKWTEPEPVVKKKKIKISSFSEQEELLIQQKTKAVLSSMKPGSLTSLASEDVNYIIIRSEDDCEPPTAKKKRLKLVKVDKPVKEVGKKPKEVQPITGPFECIQDGFCHRIFFSCCEFSTHYRDEHTRRRKGLRCQVCEKPLSLDVDECHPYACEVCGKGFSTSKQLSEHMSEAHVKLKPFQCTVCQKRFTQQGGVAQHMRMHTGDRPFSCTFCPKAFTQKSGLDQHLRIHTKVKPYRCVICSKAFCQSIHLKQHMRTHTNVSPFQCGICGKRFKQSSHLNYHLRNHNPHTMTEEQKQKYHELVGMMTREIVEVEVDQAEVPEEDQVIVEEIEQTAAEQSIQVKEELLIEQAGTEHYILSDGGQETWSVQLGGVAQHMRMHTGDRPFSCTFCPKAFTQKSGLDQHLRIHTKVKPYRCVICSKAFCQSIHLKQHMRTHTNVSPFQCGICGKRFKQSSHLNYHLRNHNPHTMTEEQKQKYHELVGMMTREIVEVEVDQAEVPEEDQVIVEEIEQTAAEQSIQVKEELLIEQAGTEHYILSDGGQETWSVQLVEI